MTGPKTHAVYIGDDGVHYKISLPTWEFNLTNAAATISQGGTVATSEPPLPKGIRRRRRFMKENVTPFHTHSVTVLDPASTLYTKPIGTGVEIPLLNTAPPVVDNGTLQGRTGEKLRGT